MTLVASEARDGGVALLTLDRPRANAFTPELVDDLSAAFDAHRGARAIVLASSQKIFSAGWDLPTIVHFDRAGMKRFLASYSGLVRRIFAHDAPVIAAIGGHAIAGGLILAAAADERIAAAEGTSLGLSEVVLGVPLPRPLFEMFRWLLGERGAERLAAAGENLLPAQAAALGLVDEVVPQADVLDRALARARTLGERPRAAHGEIKRRSREEALARFDAGEDGDPFLDTWFAPEARSRISALVEKLTKKR